MKLARGLYVKFARDSDSNEYYLILTSRYDETVFKMTSKNSYFLVEISRLLSEWWGLTVG